MSGYNQNYGGEAASYQGGESASYQGGASNQGGYNQQGSYNQQGNYNQGGYHQGKKKNGSLFLSHQFNIFWRF